MSLFTVQTSEPQVAAAPVLDDERPAGGSMTGLISLAEAALRVSEAPSAFPSTSASPTEHGTPFYHGPDDIPIDPALHGPPVDPALLVPSVEMSNGVEIHAVKEALHKMPLQPHLTYLQGPQGDPFAPQPPPSFVPAEVDPPLPPKAAKKKRKPRREPDCSFCSGNDLKNKAGDPELMVTCADCGRSGHPTCLQLADQADTLRSYEWQCTECKTCEVCQEKDGDNRFLLCDACDRGWHMECLNPPLEQEPPGKWYCPRCPPPAPEPPAEPYMEVPDMDFMATCPAPPPMREASVASSSRSVAASIATRSKRKGKARALTTDESEIEVDDGVTPTRSTRRKSYAKGKPPADALTRMESEVEVEEVSASDDTRPSKRMRVRLSSPQPKPPTIRLRLPARGKGKERAEEVDDGKKGMFDDLLPPEDRDVGATAISPTDKSRFDRSRTLAEEKLMPPPPPPETGTEDQPESSTRPLRSSHQKLTPAPSASPAPSTPLTTTPHHENYLRIRSIRFGEYDIQTWFDAPFPEEYMTIPDGRLWICEFCLKYMKSKFNAFRHRLKCKIRHPPGDEIYRAASVAIFEVDGRKNKIYCQNLCLLSKMFLDHKSLFYDVEPFLFYVITEVDEIGARFVGYFSKEKRSPKDYNVSCIMTLPVRQRQGWGNLLIDFSYLLSKKEQRTGSPEKPLSALGALGYRNYWTLAIMRYLRTAPDNPRLEDISAATAMTIEDICGTLVHLKMIDIHDRVPTPRPLPGQAIKNVKGRKSGVARKHLQRTMTQDDEKVKGPFVPPTSYTVSWDRDTVEQYLARWEAKGYLKLQPENLKWSPFLIARARKSDGLPGEDGVPPSATETATPTTDALVTPIAGPSSEGGILGTTVASPAFNLFDDDEVEIARRSTSDELPTMRPPSPDEGDTRSPRSSQRLRRHRSTSPGTVDADATPRPKRSRRSTTLAVPRSSTRRQSDRPPPRRTRSIAQLSSPRHDADLIAEDAALAARLAMEEDQPRRQLRSRSNTEQDAHRPVSPSTPRTASSVSPRKRKRVESPPSPPMTTRQTRSQALLPTLSRPQTRRSSSSSNKTPTKRRSKPPRRPSRLAKEIASLEDAARSSSPEPDPDHEPEPPASPTPSFSVHAESTSGGHAVVAAVPDPPGQAVAVEDDGGFAGDTGTPNTGATSRQSVGHSDDTVYVADDQVGAGKAVVGSVEVQPNGRPEQAPAPEDSSFQLPADGAPDGSGAVDADAEGEEDAEGEADAEGEDDIDAEGEPDTGDDIELDTY